MTTSPAQPPAASKPSPQAPLADLVALAEKHAGEQMAATVNRMAGALLDLTAPVAGPAEARPRIKSGNLLKNNSYAFFHLASTGLGLALRKEIAQLSPVANAARPVAVATLSLVPMAEMDNKVAFGAITRPFDIAHPEQLATLGVRLGMLLGRDLPCADQNPFRPELFWAALDDAWREFEPDTEGHALMLPLLRPDIVFDLGPLFEALNRALVRKGQGEGARFRKTDGAAAARAAKANRDAAGPAAARTVRWRAGIPGVRRRDRADPRPAPYATGSGGWRPSAATGRAFAPIVLDRPVWSNRRATV
jgi:hypothetical protein